MPKKYRVTLTAEERTELEGMLGKGKADARRLAHVRILHQVRRRGRRPGPARTDEQVAAGPIVSTRTVERVRQRFVEDGPQDACSRSRRSGATPACSTASRRPT